MTRGLLIILLFYSICFSQGRMNAFGIGHFNKNQGVKNAIDGITELSPSLIKNVSLSNPSTWHNLRFTYLSLSYSGNDNSFKNLSIFNGYSSLSDAIWIVPIKSKSSFGISLSPYTNQKISVYDSDIPQFYAFEDTLILSKSFDRYGGIMSFSVGSSYLLNDRVSLGIKMNILFGSSRQNQSIIFDGSGIVKQSRIRYNGLLNDIFLSFNLTENLTVHSSALLALSPLDGVFAEKYLFDDANGNGYHDLNQISDFPHPDSVSSYSEYRTKNIHDPIEYKIGFNQLISSNSAISFQMSSAKEKAENLKHFTSPINYWIEKTSTIKISYIKYSNSLSLKLIDKLSLRSGLKFSQYDLNQYGSNIREFGVLIGLGFKFKLVGNQLDINYYMGNREYPNYDENEFIHQIQFGVSLADLWFVKRRQK